MHFLLLGVSLGLSAGLSPGPLLALVIATTLRSGFWQGLRVAVAPFLSDLPIVLLALLVLNRLPDWTLAAVGLIGGAYVVALGWETVRSAGEASLERLRGDAVPVEHLSRQSLRRGAIVNLLNPHPYLFWATVGGPTLLAAWAQGPAYAGAFLLGFYGLLVGSKIAVAALLHGRSDRLSGPWFGRLLRLLGLALVGLGLWLALHGIRDLATILGL